MIERYENYLGLKDSVSFEEAVEIYGRIAEQLADSGEGAEIFEEYVAAAVDYAKVRSGWLLLSRREKEEQDSRRTALHDRSIIALNILARWMNMEGKDCTWRDALGDSTWRMNDYDVKKEIYRKRIGDFNCYAALFYGLNAR
ncbi:MAG: hypothetical protein II759_04685 [Lachnospiraceae bacterium]|nr:hypothetical protein [Lachnospiraceae bacterium]